MEHFWQIYDHLKRPSSFTITTEFHLFKDGIHPTWEDPQNQAGGKWMIRLKKGIASRYWEEIILAVIGEQFDVGPEICGAVMSVRNGEDIISVWNKTADNTEAVNKIRDQLRRILKLPSIIQIEYKRHQDSLVDKSSYRNPTMVYKPPQASNNNPNHNRSGADGHHHHQNRPDREGSGGHGGDRPHREYNKGGGYQHPNGERPQGWSSSGAAGNNRGERGEYRGGPGGVQGAQQHQGGQGAAGGERPAHRTTAWQNKGDRPQGGGWARGAALPAGSKAVDGKDKEQKTHAAAPPVPSPSTGASGGGESSPGGAPPSGYKRVPFPGIGSTPAAAAASAAPASASAAPSLVPPANAWAKK